jgi:membrane-associated phospholipid phosphatase
VSREHLASSSVHSPNGILFRRVLEPALPERLTFILTAALCMATFGATPAMAGDLPADSAPAFSSRPYAQLFEASLDVPAEAPSLAQQAAKAAPPPEPRHTGFAALVRTTGSDFVAFPKRKSTWAILAIGAGAALAVHPWDDEINDAAVDADGLRKFLKPGKYLGYAWVQGGAAAGMYLIGRYAMKPDVPGTHTNKVSHLGFDLLRANLLTQAFTYGIKYVAQRDRPTGECCAFPSGHASVTFATAAVLERHFGYRASWPMFLIAGYVSASRITDNRHFMSDVLFGAALGMATGWTVVGRHGRDDFTLVPTPVRGGVMLAGSWSPKFLGTRAERR